LVLALCATAAISSTGNMTIIQPPREYARDMLGDWRKQMRPLARC
jgi:hypothetical protein